jgi:hypothetical protein
LTLFLAVCACLVLLSGLFYLLPGRYADGADAELARANVEWYRQRQAELAVEGADALADDARLRLLARNNASVAPAG